MLFLTLCIVGGDLKQLLDESIRKSLVFESYFSIQCVIKISWKSIMIYYCIQLKNGDKWSKYFIPIRWGSSMGESAIPHNFQLKSTALVIFNKNFHAPVIQGIDFADWKNQEVNASFLQDNRSRILQIHKNHQNSVFSVSFSRNPSPARMKNSAVPSKIIRVSYSTTNFSSIPLFQQPWWPPP